MITIDDGSSAASALTGRIATDAEVDDLRTRLTQTRRIPMPRPDDRDRGIPRDLLDRVLAAWQSFDVAAWARAVDALPWIEAGAGAAAVRMLHQRTTDPDAPTVVLLHGWPDSVLRFERVLPLLTDLNVLVPALPGYPFAAAGSGASAGHMAELIADAIAELGIGRYVVAGGDIGSTVAEMMAAKHPDRVTALHLTNIAPQHIPDPSVLTDDDRAYLQTAGAWMAAEGGYLAQQRSRPNTLAIGLADSPAGLAAWIVEKLDRWADTSHGLGNVWSDEEIAGWLSAYWFTGSIATAFSSYSEPTALPARVDTPTVLSVFPHDIRPAPRGYAEHFVPVHAYLEHERGGHFAAWERPEEWSADLRRAVELGASRS